MFSPNPFSATPVPGPALRVEPTARGLRLHGECDVPGAAVLAAVLAAALRRAELRGGPCEIDLSHVSFADTSGLEPLADAIRRCRGAKRSEPTIVDPSRAVRRVFATLGVCSNPFDLAAWDAAEAHGHQTDVHRRTTSMISTVRIDLRAVTVRVAGVLDREVAAVLCEVLRGHERAGRRRVALDVAPVEQVGPPALRVLARTVADLDSVVVMGPFSQQARAAFPQPEDAS